MEEILDIIENIAKRRIAEGKDVTLTFLTEQVPEATPTELIVALHNSETKSCKEGEVNCPKCGNKRYIEKLDSNGFWVTQICSCTCKNARNYALIKNGFDKTWDDYTVNEYWQSEILKKAKAFVSTEKEWFYVGGQSGAGKTLICTIIGNELIKRKRAVLKINWSDFIQRVKNSLMDKDIKKFEAYLKRAQTYDVLYIDDLCKTYSEADLNYLFQIINYRYANGKQTFISSERDIAQLHKIDEAIAGRIIERTRMNEPNNYMYSIQRNFSNDWRRIH